MFDTHCHIHMKDYALDASQELANAKKQGIKGVICIGEGAEDSMLASQFAAKHKEVYLAIGVHPHSAKDSRKDLSFIVKFAQSKPNKLVAIGECGLDYFYLKSPKIDQKKVFRTQLELATNLNLPMIWHVRSHPDNPEDAFNDFFAILADFPSVQGVVHSFSADAMQLVRIIERDLFVGLNGIMTFTKDEVQLEAAKAVPLNKLLLETDAPFLTPTPFRGKINSPRYVVDIAEYLANLRGESLELLSRETTLNAQKLFGIEL